MRNMNLAPVWHRQMGLVIFFMLIVQCRAWSFNNFTCKDVSDIFEKSGTFRNCEVSTSGDMENIFISCLCECLKPLGSSRNRPNRHFLTRYVMKPVASAEFVSSHLHNFSCLELLISNMTLEMPNQLVASDRPTTPIMTNCSLYNYFSELKVSLKFHDQYPITTMYFSEKIGLLKNFSIDDMDNVFLPTHFFLLEGINNDGHLFFEANSSTSNVIIALMSFVESKMFPGFNLSFPQLAFESRILKEMPTEALQKLAKKYLAVLGIHSTLLSSVGDKQIPQIDTLEELDLSFCTIDTISEHAFDGIPNLRILNLRGNEILALPVALGSLHNLEVIDLNANRYNFYTHAFTYNSGVLVNHAKLIKLDLSHKYLKCFWENVDTFLMLETLILTRCGLVDLPLEGLSRKMKNLKILFMPNNMLGNVSMASLTGLTKLQHLELTGNQIVDIPYNAIINMLPNLEIFHLGHNQITDFLPLNLSNVSLKKLDLSYNKITSWKEPKLYSGAKSLILNLYSNNITEVNSEMIRDFEQLRKVSLSRNRFDCKSCTLENFLTWLNTTSTSTDFIRSSSYQCYYPKVGFGELIDSITLNHCTQEVFDWVRNVLVPCIAVPVFLTCVGVTLYLNRWHVGYCCYLFRARARKHRRDNENGSAVYRYDAFVSYCSTDVQWVVRHLVPVLEEQDPKLHLCIHERDFLPGNSILHNIVECIDASQRSIFLLTPKFIESEWCQWELQMARHKLFDDKRGKLLLVMLEEINVQEAPKLLQRLIATETYLQWPSNENGQKLFLLDTKIS